MSTNTTFVTLCDEITIATARDTQPQLVAALSAEMDIEIDVSQVSEIDSAGLQLLIAAKHEAIAQHKTLRLVDHSQTVLDLLDRCDLVGFFGDPIVLEKEPAV